MLNEPKIIEIAGMLNLNMDRFRKKMNDPALKDLIESDYEEAKKLDIPATPWVYLNGRHLMDRSFTGFVNTIDRELKK